MDSPFSTIDPNGITLKADGSIHFQNAEVRASAVELSSRRNGLQSTNSGTCTNAASCTATNLNCSNAGSCTGENLGQCKVVAT